MFKIGDKLTKENYTQGAIWCNANNAMIAKQGSEYVLVAMPEPTAEELQAEVRAVRNSYLETYVDPKQLVMVWDSLSADDKKLYKDYRQYLLDYTEVEGWYLQNPKTLDEWKNTLVPEENEQEIKEINSSDSEEVIEDGLQREEKEIEEPVVELYSMEI